MAHDTSWLDRAENLLLFGPSGVGKTHLSAGLCRSLIALNRSARFFSATTLLFELVMHCYERRSLLVTSNQPFSAWENAFSTSAMTVAAVDRLEDRLVDRLVDHSTIIQINSESCRRKRARRVGGPG